MSDYGKMKVVWHRQKAVANWKRRHISFDEAATVLRDPLMRLEADLVTPHMYRMIGHSAQSRLILTVFVQIDEGQVRIVSARKPTNREREMYESGEFGDRRRYGRAVRNPFYRRVQRYGIHIFVEGVKKPRRKPTNPYFERIRRGGLVIQPEPRKRKPAKKRAKR